MLVTHGKRGELNSLASERVVGPSLDGKMKSKLNLSADKYLYSVCERKHAGKIE